MKKGEAETAKNRVYPTDPDAKKVNMMPEDEKDEDNIDTANEAESQGDFKGSNDGEDKQQEIEDGEGGQSDKQMRGKLESFLNNDSTGRWIQIFIAITSITSSVSFIIMTKYDWSEYDPCCEKAVKMPLTGQIEYNCPNSCGIQGCLLRCD